MTLATTYHQKNFQQFALSQSLLFLVAFFLVVSFTLPSQAANGEQSDEMAYIPFTVTVMGIDKEASQSVSDPQESRTMYDKRMTMPWSQQAFHDEGPAHWVVMDAYFIDKHEVSNRDYESFMKATGHSAPAYWDDPRLNKPDQPVVGVNWHDSMAFCEWKGKRLPTEAEWENAARGPEGLRFPWGNSFDPSKANFGKQNTSTLPVDSMPEGRSYYGLHHMAGNVFEWVQDWYDPNFYKKIPHDVNPRGPQKPLWLGGTGTYVDRLTVGEKRIIRGGSWIAAEHTIRATHRFWNHPSNNSYGGWARIPVCQDCPSKNCRRNPNRDY